MTQVALTVVLLCVSGLLARSFRELTRHDLGLDPREVLTLNVGLDGEPYDSRGPEYVGFYQQAIERVESLPGVRSAAAAFSVPITGEVVAETPFHIEGGTEVPPSERPRINLRMVTPGYFRTLGIPIVQGRDFSASDRRDSPTVFMVNQSLADLFIRDRDPLTASAAIGDNKPYRTGRIIGVAADTKEDSLRGGAEPTVFFTYSQIATSTDMFMFIKADNATGVAQAAIQAIREVDGKIPVYDVQLLEDVFGESIARERLSAVVSGAFALTALLLAVSGLYGLLTFQVAERNRKIGIRIALGSRTSEVLRMVFGESLRLIIPGVVLGLGAALLFTRLIESLLFGIPPRDPVTFAAVVALTTAAGAVAAFAPAWRATRVDPLVALRQE